MVRIIRQSIFDSKAKYICHQVNCMNAMGAGVASAIYKKWPIVKKDYRELCNRVRAPELLGMIQFVPVEENKTVINIFSQFDYGCNPNIVYTNYNILAGALESINDMCADETLAFPYGFGCGLANGDWKIVEKIIVRKLRDCSVEICLNDFEEK